MGKRESGSLYMKRNTLKMQRQDSTPTILDYAMKDKELDSGRIFYD